MKKSLEDIVKRSVNASISDSVSHPLLIHSFYSVPDPVRNIIWRSVYEPVAETVKFSVQNFVIYRLA